MAWAARLIRRCGAVVAGCLVTPAMIAAESAALTVAVFDFESNDPSVRELGPRISALLNAHLSANPRVITVERAELDKILSEFELGLSGTIDPDTTARVGHWTGAKALVTGRVFKAGPDLVVVAKIVGSETGRVYGELVTGESGSSPVPLAQELGDKIASVLTDRRDTLLAKVETREARLQRLLRGLSDKPRPSVSVTLPERHFGAPATDPAAETEFLLILREAGFPVHDRRTGETTDLEISGEAFSTFGLRKGNLYACKARLELRVHRPASGALVVADRQTSVVIDIAERTAAKTALQNAAFDLAERILPKLVQ